MKNDRVKLQQAQGKEKTRSQKNLNEKSGWEVYTQDKG
jgi:hypothetical protein